MAARARNLRASFVLASLALHVLLLGVAATRRTPSPVSGPRQELTAPSTLEMMEEVVVEMAEVPSPRSAELSGGRASSRLHAGRVAPSPVQSTPLADVGADASAEAVEGAEPPDESPAPTASTGPRLSLAQLGVAGENPFLDRGDPAAARAAKAQSVKRRLDRALAQGLTNADVERGHGAHGPVLRVLEAAVYASNAPLNGQASFVFVIDGSGKLLSATLGDASGDRAAWLRVARQTAQSLAKLPVKNGKGVKVTVAVTSHLELPSGADPGLEISMQGVPLKKGDGPRSTRLDLSLFPFPAATLGGDPADIGARPRRMVHSHVVSEELL